MPRSMHVARKPSSRLIINRAAMSKVGRGIANGMAEVGRTILETADVPDAPPYGQGLVDTGGYVVYHGSKKVDGFGMDGKQPKKPRAAKVRGTDQAVTLFVGWGFPGRFVDHGTIDTPATGFGTKAVNRVAPHIGDIVRPHVAEEVG